VSCLNDCATTENYTIPLLESSYGNIPSCHTVLTWSPLKSIVFVTLKLGLKDKLIHDHCKWHHSIDHITKLKGLLMRPTLMGLAALSVALRPSVSPSVCPSLRPSCITSDFVKVVKAVETSNLVETWPWTRITKRANLRSKGQRSRSLGTKMQKSFFVHIFAKGWSIYVKRRSKWSPYLEYVFFPAKCIVFSRPYFVRLSVRNALCLNSASWSKSYYWQPIWSRIWEIDWHQNEWPRPLFRGRIKVMSTITSHSPLYISETVRDRGLVPNDHQ